MSIAAILAGRPGDDTPNIRFTDLRYWFRADQGVFSDVAGTTPAVNNDPVAHWNNNGTAEDAVQNTAGVRPVYKTGGLNGKPYIEFDRSGSRDFFEDLNITQPGGINTHDHNACFVVWDAVDVTTHAPILGQAVGNKTYFGATAGATQLWHGKSGFLSGTVVNPSVYSSRISSLSDVRKGINGVYTTVSSGATFVTTAAATTQFFRHDDTNLRGMHGRVYEFLYYGANGADVILSAAEQDAIDAYLRTKYGL